MKQRILVAVIGVPALIGVLCFAPDWATAVLVAALCVVIGGGALAFMLIKRKPDPAQLYVNQKAAREAEAAQEDAEAEKPENL